MKLVNLETPYAGGIAENIDYARRCMADSLSRGEAPLASHLLYTQPGILDDDNPAERGQGIAAGFAWNRHAEATVVYTDRGISAGMMQGIEDAARHGRPVEYRGLPGYLAQQQRQQDHRATPAKFEQLATGASYVATDPT